MINLQDKFSQFGIDINRPLKELDNECLIELENYFKNKSNINKIENTPKYKILLKILNDILVNVGKKEIEKITDFQHISREDIILEKNEKYIDEITDEILEYYNKADIMFYQKKSIKTYTLSFIKNACSLLGFQLVSAKKDTTITGVNGKKEKTFITYYSILTI